MHLWRGATWSADDVLSKGEIFMLFYLTLFRPAGGRIGSVNGDRVAGMAAAVNHPPAKQFGPQVWHHPSQELQIPHQQVIYCSNQKTYVTR